MLQNARIDELCIPKSSNLAQKDILENVGEYPVYGASGFIRNVNFYHQESEYVAVVKDGAGIGRAMLLPAKSSIIGTMQYLIPKNNVDTKYLYYAIKSMNLSKYFSGATIPHIYFKDYKKELVPLYSKDKQKLISSSLEKLENIVAIRQQQLFEYDQIIKSRFVEMFGDISINSKSFDIKPFGDLCFKIGDGLHGTPLYDDKGNYYFINGNNLGNDCIKITETTKKVNEEVFKKYYVQFGENTVFLSINGTLGNVALYNDEPIILGKSAAYCNLKPSLHIKFIAELFKTNKFKEYMLSNSSGTTITNFGLKAFRNYPMIVPPMILQTQFTNFVEQIDKLKFVVQQSLNETQQLFDSLMQEYFG